MVENKYNPVEESHHQERERFDALSGEEKHAEAGRLHEKALIEKAAYLIGGLAWAQAFSGGNKRTAILSCALFFSQNGYHLNIPTDENPQLRQLLYDIQEERSEINCQIIEKIISYITKHVSLT